MKRTASHYWRQRFKYIIASKLSFILALSISAVLLLSISQSYAQTMKYSYDAMGNRVKKEIVFQEEDDENLEALSREKQSFEGYFSEESFKVYPNPVNQSLNIEFDSEILDPSLHFKIINSQGKVVEYQNISYYNIQLDLSMYSKGLYTLLIANHQHQTNWKIIKN